ncbi:chemotaxis response regulator protein-glutamate methylesterase [Alteromonas sp. ASW11-36]|uniref:Protein-glutamate methylesterase/protein-glutamine glutaminase n=1 Tax=Alteromonas arenosi TaxID=3055817 RepID=A0ABT7T345_9ALTE|nr:chemotaxis response regulator protein-glutamate methylesterase [Alteromonas sp. ASW11-36]MDM7862184.1 chemotaxis response regulator protein-glutamate methylesterase [Alteromonas sp. ASW11-36]
MITVLVVDDSALVRALLSEMIDNHPLLTLVGAAANAFIAKRMVNELKPDVITLDVEMPEVNGLVFLDRLMKARPTPVVMFSSLTEQGALATMEALALGAVDFLPKPKLDIANKVKEFEQELTDKILLASQAKLDIMPTSTQTVRNVSEVSNLSLVAIGASTGGTEAIRHILMELPKSFPAVVVSQHMPKGFTQSFAQRLNSLCQLTVVEATQGQPIKQGHVYIAPGDYHLEIQDTNDGYKIKLSQTDKVNNHRPSIDVMFNSVAQIAGRRAAGVLLTGMGKDGAQGLAQMKQAGGETIAQSEASCLIYGMPKEAVRIGAASQQKDLADISSALYQWARLKSLK